LWFSPPKQIRKFKKKFFSNVNWTKFANFWEKSANFSILKNFNKIPGILEEPSPKKLFYLGFLFLFFSPKNYKIH